ncbi:hypothetical protein [Paraburkholderia rhizosphaerae]|nr:hypothetical protein [Paraburkholderia rhizosphaerae]
MKIMYSILTFFFVCACVVVRAADNGLSPEFSDYRVNVYRGRLKVPVYYVKIGNKWRDDMGKMVSPPVINFSGKYHIGIHSCGADCRYYTLSNLMSGADSGALDPFSNAGEQPNKTSDGRIYITNLISRPDSKMLIAQYYIDRDVDSEGKCREQIFTLNDDGKRVMPITKTIDSCRQFP